jgi:hypothetical protein
MQWYDYETTSMNGGNPYYCCVGCGKTDPAINGDIDNHGPNCTEVARYKQRQFEEKFADMNFIALDDDDSDFAILLTPTERGANVARELGYVVTTAYGAASRLTHSDAEALADLVEAEYGMVTCFY